MTAICIGRFILYGMAGLADLKWGYLLIQRYNWKQVATTPHGNIYIYILLSRDLFNRPDWETTSLLYPSFSSFSLEAIKALLPSSILRKHEKGRIHQTIKPFFNAWVEKKNTFHIVLHYEPWSDLHQYKRGYSRDFHYLFPILQIN